jgi:pimeloyl-ACP methyl ester carboxylesterase
VRASLAVIDQSMNLIALPSPMARPRPASRAAAAKLTPSECSPTIVLVHGALTDASIWHQVIAELHRRHHHVLAPAMPMRGLASDAAYLRSVLDTIEGPVAVAAHSYGGSIISDSRALTPAVRSLGPVQECRLSAQSA